MVVTNSIITIMIVHFFFFSTSSLPLSLCLARPALSLFFCSAKWSVVTVCTFIEVNNGLLQEHTHTNTQKVQKKCLVLWKNWNGKTEWQLTTGLPCTHLPFEPPLFDRNCTCHFQAHRKTFKPYRFTIESRSRARVATTPPHSRHTPTCLYSRLSKSSLSYRISIRLKSINIMRLVRGRVALLFLSSQFNYENKMMKKKTHTHSDRFRYRFFFDEEKNYFLARFEIHLLSCRDFSLMMREKN